MVHPCECLALALRLHTGANRAKGRMQAVVKWENRRGGFRDVNDCHYRNGQTGCFRCQHRQSGRKAMAQDKELSRKKFIRKALVYMLYSTLLIQNIIQVNNSGYI